MKSKPVLGRGMAALLSTSIAQPQIKKSKDEKSISEGEVHQQAKLLKEKLDQKNQEKQSESGPIEPPHMPSHQSANLVDIGKIKANSHQPRKVFKDQALDELAQSIKENGIIQPLIVQYDSEQDSYEIIAGERRFRAAKKIGLQQVPVVIKNTTKKDKLVMAIIENVQRSNLNCVEEALAYFQLMNEFNLTQEEVAKKIGKERSNIANHLRLLRLPKEVIMLLQKEKITFGHGKILAGVSEPEDVINLAQWCSETLCSVRQLEDKVKSLGVGTKKKAPKNDASKNFQSQRYESLRQKIERQTGLHIDIKAKKNGSGSMVLKFSSDEEFNKIYDIMVRK